LGVLAWQRPDLILGRTGQVSILSPTVHNGDFWGTLLNNTGRSLGLFLFRGDPILRHNALLDYKTVLLADNPAGRPVFDLFMAVPFLIGVIWCIAHWRRPAAATVLLWQIVMLGPTLLAADAPHFLRAAGLLPAAVFLPALGLAWLWNNPVARVANRRLILRAAVLLLLLATLATTVHDYRVYARQPDVGYLFEAAAADLAHSITAEAPATTVFVDERFWAGWPSIPFLAGDREIVLFAPAKGLPPELPLPAAVYAWPYDSLEFIARALPNAALLTVKAGSLARGDLERSAYSLYTRYGIAALPGSTGFFADFDRQLVLTSAAAKQIDARTVQIDLYWQPGDRMRPAQPLPVAFVHVVGPAGLLAQSDEMIGGGLWAAGLWRPGLVVHEQRTISLPQPFDPQQQRLLVGLYHPETLQRLPVVGTHGQHVADEVEIEGIDP
jgi:hypothetical protein